MIKKTILVWALIGILASFAGPASTAEEGSQEPKAPNSEVLQTPSTAAVADLAQARKDLIASSDRIKALEQQLAALEHEMADVQHRNLALQDASDMAREDVDLMRAEMQRCTGDRAHLDDLAVRYQMSQTQLYDLRQQIGTLEASLATVTRDRDELQSSYDWIKARQSSYDRIKDRGVEHSHQTDRQ